MLEPGLRLAQYEIQRRLGGGETSGVWLARDLVLDRPVAVKLLDRRGLHDRAIQERLRPHDFDHPNIVQVFAVIYNGGPLYVVMEYVDGEPIEALIERRSPVALVDKLQWLEELSAAAAYLHGRESIHGDITPARVMIGPRGQLKLLGAAVTGTAGLFAESSDARTVGSRAPERILHGVATSSGDVFSIGVLAYELLTYTRAFPGDSPETISNRVLPPPPVALQNVCPDLPGELIDMVDRALHEEPTARPTAEAFRAAISRIRTSLPASDSGAARAAQPAARPLDEVQFTVYRPNAVRPDEWRRLLVFMHLAGRRPEAPAEEPDPIEQVRAIAQATLGKEASLFGHATADGRAGVPREGEITLVPVVERLEFEPERLSFRWVHDVHEHSFRVRARPASESYVARGRITAFLGVMLLAEVNISIRVNPSLPADHDRNTDEVSTATAYRRIFASYSRQDREIVRQFEAFVEAIGDRYLIDVRDLPAGSDWKQRLRALINQADVFQLFWSHNAMRSAHVRDEWEYALSLNRTAFVRPTYWEDPLPESPSEDLPPEQLRRLHFHRMSWPAAMRQQERPAVDPPPAPEIDHERVLAERAQYRRQVEEMLENAREALRQGDLDAALWQCEHTLALGPDTPETLELRQAILAERESTERAAAESARQAAIRERIAKALEARESQRMDDALAAVHQALLLDPANAEAKALAAALREQFRAEEAARQRAAEEAHERAERELKQRLAAEAERERRQLEEKARLRDEPTLLIEAQERSSGTAIGRFERTDRMVLAKKSMASPDVNADKPRRVVWYVAAALLVVAVLFAWILLF